ncbi:MAG: dicarboxylate/amino acid:cation symporter [Gammaproteobacteria bacterium]|nr:dicarboxylate/amino acid:cation symporter [Gammaproteobacteria bacterium]
MLNRRGYWMILVAIFFAVLAGWSQQPVVLKLAELVSEIFVRLLKLISLPMISLSLLATISSVGENSLSQLGKRIVTYTILTTAIAASIALILYEIIKPVLLVTSETVQATTSNISYFDELLKVIPSNLLQPFLEGNVVSIMLLSLLIGFGVAKLPNEQRLPIHQLLQSLFQMMMQITRWIVGLMPIAIWGFMTSFVIEVTQGLSYTKLGWYLTTILSANLIQAIVILPLFLWWHGISPKQAFIKMLPALSFAFFSKSSTAAMPTAIDCAEREMNVDSKVARFSFPLCTSINMNACAAFILITVLFIAQSQGMAFSLTDKLTWIVIATVAAIGNAGVPMGCFFIASALLSTMNLPLTLMGVILPFYALLDMLESAINIWSDSCVTLAVNQKTVAVESEKVLA